MNVFILLMFTAIAVSDGLTVEEEGCRCDNDNVPIAKALADPDKQSLCKFAEAYHMCLKDCDPATADLLQAAIDATPCGVCAGADTIIVSSLCLILPVLQTLL